MFETLAIGVLTNVMGSFIDPKCFSPDKINVAVWSGDIALRDLELKPDVIAHPSINLVRGVIGSIELKIPWNRLQSESVILTVDDVYLLVRTEEDIEGVLMEMDEFTIKKQLLEQLYREAKKTQEDEKETTSDSPKEDGFTARLVNKIIDNIELHIRRIHVRVEDHSTGDHPFAAGLTIESVHAQSTNSNWQPSYVDTAKSNEPRIYKMIQLNHLSVYLNPHCEVLQNQRIDFQTCSLEAFCHAFNHSIPKRFDDRHPIQLYPFQQRHHFILKPLDASARLIVNRDPFDTSIPKFEVDINIAEVAVRLEESQYCDLLYLASAFQVPEHHKKYQQYRKLRPRKSVFDSPSGEWWSYAISAVIQDIRTKKLRWSWKYMKKRRDDRIKYQLLWEQHVRDLELGPSKSTQLVDSEDEYETDEDVEPRTQSTLGNSDMSSEHSASSRTHKADDLSGRVLDGILALEEIERQRPIEDILFFRYLADKKIEEQARIRSEEVDPGASQVLMPPFSDSESVDTELTESSLPTEMRYRSWGKWMFGWTSRVGVAPSPGDKNSAPKRAFPEVELRELFKIVEYEPAKRAKRRHRRGLDRTNDSYVDLDEETDNAVSDLVSRVTLSLGKGSVTLASDPETNRRLTRDDPNYGSRYAPTDFLLGSFTHLQVAAITKGDSTKVDVSLHTIDAFDESAESMAFSRLLTRKQDRAVSGTDDDGGLMNANRMAGPVFLLSYETNPVGIAADAALFVHLEPLEIVFSPTARCWGRLGSFLNTPQALGLWAELEVASLNDIVNLKARTEAKLDYVMANRVALSVDLRVQAPLIVISESDSDINCARMVIDLGHINFRTERLSRLDSNAATMQSSTTFTNGSAPSSLSLVNPLASPPLTSSMSFVKQLYDEAERGEGAIRWKEEFYDKFALAITNVHVLLIPHGAAISPASKDLLRAGLPVPTSASLLGVRLNTEWELVERFNINVTLRTSVLPLDATLTRIYVHADLPALTFNLSLEKYFQLVALAERFGSTSASVPVGGEGQQFSSFGQSMFDSDKEQHATAPRSAGLTDIALNSLNTKEGHDIKIPQMLTHSVGNNDDEDDLSDAESDDTWFSITSGNVEVRATEIGAPGAFTLSEFEDFSLDATSNDRAVASSTSTRQPDTTATQQRRTKSRGRRGSFTIGSGEVIDRRLFVCTFTIPVIAVHLKKPQDSSDIPLSASARYDGGSMYDDDVIDCGTLVLKLEGFRVRIGKKTLSTQVDFNFRSLDVEDYFDLSGRSSEHLLFSSPAIAAPYDLRAPPRRSMPYVANGASRRRVSRQRERVLTFQGIDGSSSRADYLLDVTFASSSDRRTGAEVSRDVSVHVGAIHLIFDQSYVCSLLELFEETISKISTPSNAAVDDDDGDDDFLDAIPPPLELSPSMSQEFSLPESVMADLERAKKELLQQQIAVNVVSPSSNIHDSTKLPVSVSVKVMIGSVSALLCDRSDAIVSVAVVGTKLQFSTGGEEFEESMNVSAIVKDVRVYDLLSAKGSGAIISQTQPRYLEIFGLQRNEAGEAIHENFHMLEIQGVTKERQLQSDHNINESSVDVPTAEASVRIQPIQLVVHSPFIEGIVNYVAHGALATYFAMKQESFGKGRSRRRKRTESFASELSHRRANGLKVSSPVSTNSHKNSLAGTPFFGPKPDPSCASNDPKHQLLNAKNHNGAPDVKSNSRFAKPFVKIELIHPSVVFPCGREFDSSAEALILDLGVITAHGPRGETANNASINIEGLRILKRSDQTKILEETSVGVTYKSSFGQAKITKEHTIDVSVSPMTINIGERDLCLGIDLSNDVFEPVAQVVANVSRSPLRNAIFSSESLQSASPSTAEKTLASTDISVKLEYLKLVMVAQPSTEFEGWLKTTMETAEAQWNRDSIMAYAPAGTPGSPRRRRHLYSFAQDEQNGFRSVTGAPTLASVAEIAFMDLRGSVKTCGGPPKVSEGHSGISGSLSVHEILVRDTLADETEFICQVLSRGPASSDSTPQIRAAFRLLDLTVAENGCDQELVADAVISTAMFCLLPRTLLRIENYIVGVMVALGQKLAQQDPRIASAVEQQSLLLTDTKTASSSIVDPLSSHDRISGYPSGHSRKNSIAESLKDAYAGSISARLKDVYEESESSSSTKPGDKKSRMILKLNVQLDQFQLWMLASDRKRDAYGVCVSGGLHLTVDHQPLLLIDHGPSSCVMGKASALTVLLGSPTEMNSQSFEVVEPVGVEVQMIVQHVKKGDRPSDISDKAREIQEQSTEHIPRMWDSWKSVDTSITLSTVSTKVSFKDLPVILKSSSMLSAIIGAESHVRRKLEALAPQVVDPYLDLALYESERGDEAHVESDAGNNSSPNRAFRMKLETDSINFRLINNLVDENSPVVGFRVGPIHLLANDISDTSTTIGASCSLEAWYHNLRLVAPEPLIEPWSFSARCSKVTSPDKRIPQGSGEGFGDDQRSQYPWQVSISSSEFIQFNVTDALITNIMAANRAWEWMSKESGVDSSDRSEYSTYWIRNETGLLLRYWSRSCAEDVLGPGDEKPLTFRGMPRSRSGDSAFDKGEAENNALRQLFIAAEDGDDAVSALEGGRSSSRGRWESEFAIPVDQADSRMYALVDFDAESHISSRVRKCECVIDVLVERGCKVFVVRSTLMLENNTASDLEVEYVPPLRRTASPPFRAGTNRGHLVPSWKAVVGPSSTIPVPVNLVSAMDGYLMVRPPDLKSPTEGSSISLPKAYAKKRVHLPLFDRVINVSAESSGQGSVMQISSGEPQCVIKFHRLYGDRPVRPFMMSATLSFASDSLYQRKVTFQPPLVFHNLTAGPLEYSIATPSDWKPPTDGVNNTSSSVNLGWEDCQQRLRERGVINVADSLVWHLCDWDTPLELRIRVKGFEWSEPLQIDHNLAEDTHRIRMVDLSSSAHLFVSAEMQVNKARCKEFFFFVPYWIVNLTGLKLEYEHDDERAAYEHSTMMLAGQKRLDRDEMLLKEEQARSSSHHPHPLLVRTPSGGRQSAGDGDRNTEDNGRSAGPSDDRRRRHPGLIPSVPPIKGLLDLLPKPIEDSRSVGQLEVLQACHSSTQPERGCIRVRVNEFDRRITTNGSESSQRKWTDSIVLDQPGTSGELEAADFGLDRVYSIGYSITTAKGRYSRTKVIMLTPRFMIVNAMDAAVEVCHSAAKSSPSIDDSNSAGNMLTALNPALHLEPGGYADFHWNLALTRSKTIRCRLADGGWTWSGAVPLGEAREYVVRMRNESTRATKLVRVVLKVDGPCVCVYLREESSSVPPYRIENYSLETFRIHQRRVRRSEILLPHHSLDYAWDEPTEERALVVDMLPSAAGDNSRPLRIGSFVLDKIHRFPDNLGGTLGIEITADGPTRVLRFTDTRIRAAGAVDANGNVSMADSREGRNLETFPAKFLASSSFELTANFRGIGISIVDGAPRELIYVAFAGISLEMHVSNGNDDFLRATGSSLGRIAKETHPRIVATRFQLRDFQIDNQLPITPYPVLLRFSNPNARTRVIDGKILSVPVMEICLVKHDGYTGIEFIRHFSMRVLPLHIRVDGSLLYQLVPVFVHSKGSNSRESQGWSRSKYSQATLLLEEYNSSLEVGVEILDVMREDGVTSVLASSSTATERESIRTHPSEFESLRRPSFTVAVHTNHHGKLGSQAEAKKLYFEDFHIDPIRATVSFSFGATAGAMVDGLHSLTDSARHSSITVGPLRLIINAIGTSLAKIANAPFHLKAISISHSFIQPDALASRLASHYQSEALRQAYVILGSVDVFGNPMVAWRNLRGGFQDFIYEPVHGISKSPTEFALGMGRGTYSLMRASVYTFLDFISRILAASSLGLSEACLKLDEYTGYPATRNIYQGFAQGISGVVVSPIRAVELNGVRGVIPGVFAGVFGFALKPLLGLSLATSSTVATLRDAIDPNTKALLMRSRPPRHIDLRTRRLKVYSYVESFGEEMVGKLRGGRYRSDGYLGHVDLKQKCFLVTRKRVLFVDVKPGPKYDVEWELHADEVVLVDWQSRGEESVLALFYIEEDYTPRRRLALAAKGMLLSKRVVPLPENRVLFVRAMLQQQERSLLFEDSDSQSSRAASRSLPPPLAQRTMSVDRLPTWQQHVPTEYPIFRLPMTTMTRSPSNLHTHGPSPVSSNAHDVTNEVASTVSAQVVQDEARHSRK